MGGILSRMSGPSLEERFQYAVNFIRSLPPKGDFQPSNDQKLTFYSHFKQGTEGPCTAPQPGFWNPVERAKWTSWDALGNMSKAEAQQKYIDTLLDLAELFPPSEQKTKLVATLSPLPHPEEIQESERKEEVNEILEVEDHDDSQVSEIPFSPIPRNRAPVFTPIVPHSHERGSSEEFVPLSGLQAELHRLKAQSAADAQKLKDLEGNINQLTSLSARNQQMMRNISASEERIGRLQMNLQSLFDQVELTLENSKSKLDSLDTLHERLVSLEEAQHDLIAQVQDKIAKDSQFSVWNAVTAGVPLVLLGWYSYSQWIQYQKRK